MTENDENKSIEQKLPVSDPEHYARRAPLVLTVKNWVEELDAAIRDGFCIHHRNPAHPESSCRPCSCLHVGRTGPPGGPLLLVFQEGDDAPFRGTVLPFETAHAFDCRDGSRFAGMSTEDVNQEVEDKAIPASRWRVEFASFLREEFDHPREYWISGPRRPDPNDIYEEHPGDCNWRCWVWEIRLEQPPLQIVDAAAWSADRDVLEMLNNQLFDGPHAMSQYVTGRLERFRANQKGDPYSNANWSFINQYIHELL